QRRLPRPPARTTGIATPTQAVPHRHNFCFQSTLSAQYQISGKFYSFARPANLRDSKCAGAVISVPPALFRFFREHLRRGGCAGHSHGSWGARTMETAEIDLHGLFGLLRRQRRLVAAVVVGVLVAAAAIAYML